MGYKNCNSARSKYSVIKINRIADVLRTSGDIYLFDVEETILQENRYYEAIANSRRNEFTFVFNRICKRFGIQTGQREALISYGKHYRRELVEEDIKYVIQYLKNHGKQVYALTSGFPSIDKFLKMEREHGISFDYVICTSRRPKGPALLQHIIKYDINDTCVFIDNHESKLRNVGDEFVYNNRSNQIKLLHYNYAEKPAKLTLQEFANYWISVIKDIKLHEPTIYNQLTSRSKSI